MAKRPPTPIQSRTDPDVAWRAAQRLATAFSAACGDLPNIFSEGNPAGRVFHRWTLALDPATPLTAESLAAALHVRAPRHVDLDEAGDSFTLDPDNDGAETALGFGLLAAMMRATLDGLFIAWVRGGASSSTPTYVFGRLDGGPLVGLHVITIET